MLDDILVSIMMPVYNGLPLIRASIESVLNQSHKNWECIIVDDGSTDGTSEYIDSLHDHRFIVHHLNKNSGRAIARQKALDLCKGKYICMLDAEDLMHPDRVKIQMEYLEEHPKIALVSSSLCSFGINTDLLVVRGPLTSCCSEYSGNNLPSHAPSMYRTSIAKKISYNPILNYGEDIDFMEHYLKENGNCFCFSDVLYYYSELDSVDKNKISRSYISCLKKYYLERNYIKSVIYLMKLIYSKCVFPFIPINTILLRRGRLADDCVRAQIEEYCYPLVTKYKK